MGESTSRLLDAVRLERKTLQDSGLGAKCPIISRVRAKGRLKQIGDWIAELSQTIVVASWLDLITFSFDLPHGAGELAAAQDIEGGTPFRGLRRSYERLAKSIANMAPRVLSC
jgi:hypothetical protein